MPVGEFVEECRQQVQIIFAADQIRVVDRPIAYPSQPGKLGFPSLVLLEENLVQILNSSVVKGRAIPVARLLAPP